MPDSVALIRPTPPGVPGRKAKSSPKRAFLMWLGYEDSNLGMPESESGALPLGDTPMIGFLRSSSERLSNLAGVRGFEPRNAGIRIRCLTAWRYPNDWVFAFVIRTSFKFGWGTRIRTSECRNQNPVPYRLAIPQEFGGYDGIRTCDPIIMSDVL